MILKAPKTGSHCCRLWPANMIGGHFEWLWKSAVPDASKAWFLLGSCKSDRIQELKKNKTKMNSVYSNSLLTMRTVFAPIMQSVTRLPKKFEIKIPLVGAPAATVTWSGVACCGTNRLNKTNWQIILRKLGKNRYEFSHCGNNDFD